MTQQAQVVKALRELETIKLDGLRFRLIDAKGMIVGRLASEIATLLQGKDKPTYTPKKNMGDVVIVINAAHVHFTHDKWETKMYHWHTGYPGGYRERPAAAQWDKDPTSILVKAVQGMLPKNRLRPYRMDKLKVFPESSHPYTGLPLVPYVPQPRTLHLPGLGWQLPRGKCCKVLPGAEDQQAGMSPMNPDIYSFRAWVGQKPRPAPRSATGAPASGLLPVPAATPSSTTSLLTGSSSSSSSSRSSGQPELDSQISALPQTGRHVGQQGDAGPVDDSSSSSSSGSRDRRTAGQSQQKLGKQASASRAGQAAAGHPRKGSSSAQSSPSSSSSDSPSQQQQQQQPPVGIQRPSLGGRRGLSHFQELLTEEEQAALEADLQREQQKQKEKKRKQRERQQRRKQVEGSHDQQSSTAQVGSQS